MAELKPGVYHDVSFDQYASWPAANHSILKHFNKTPAHAYHEMVTDEETEAKTLGYLVHMAALEPDKYKAEVAVAPKLDKRTKIGKAEWAKFEKANEGKFLARKKDDDIASAILRSVDQHPFARELLRAKGAQELSLLWKDPATGVLCKGRIDRLTTVSDQPVVVDVKTIGKPASTHNFQQAVMAYDYHGQAAHYLYGLNTLMPDTPIPRFAWVACETDPPNLVRVFEAEDEALGIGAESMAKALQQFKECQKSGFWPGWGDGMDVAGLPAWAYKRFAVD